MSNGAKKLTHFAFLLVRYPDITPSWLSDGVPIPTPTSYGWPSTCYDLGVLPNGSALCKAGIRHQRLQDYRGTACARPPMTTQMMPYDNMHNHISWHYSPMYYLQTVRIWEQVILHCHYYIIWRKYIHFHGQYRSRTLVRWILSCYSSQQ